MDKKKVEDLQERVLELEKENSQLKQIEKRVEKLEGEKKLEEDKKGGRELLHG
tara:strand:- start:362 stop:520 length:159 start_codon:yes stop_codon:yes gene_type:complete